MVKLINFFLSTVLIIIIIIICFFSDGDEHLGSGYYFYRDRKRECIILSDSLNYRGSGSQVIPPLVINFAYDNNNIIAQSAWDMLGTNSKFWIIDKKNAPNYRNDYTMTEWDSAMWQNVSQYSDSASFYEALKTKNINLKFDD